MFEYRFEKVFIDAVILATMVAAAPSSSATEQQAQHRLHPHRFILVAKSDAEYEPLRSDAIRTGAKVVRDMRQARTLVVTASSDSKAQLTASTHAQMVVPDRLERLISPQLAQEMGFNGSPSRVRIDMGHRGDPKTLTPDPAFTLPRLMWNVERVNAPRAWKTATGTSVLVGIADTGVDYTHSELAPKVVDVVDFTDSLCRDYFGMGDAEWAGYFGVDPSLASTDWNGHGSWIGGNIGAALDGVGINGIAPDVKLVSLKIAQWCGYAWDSSILDAFYYAADNGIDVVNISFGGYLDRSDPEQDAIYQAYVDAVKYAARKGTVIVAAAGNEHARIGAGGKVLSHGSLAVPGDPSSFSDYYGWYEIPGGVPGVVDVSATGNVVAKSSASCNPGTFEGSSAVCKPASDPHQASGVGRKNQLAYYSNYGPRIDVAAPGGARKFNLPSADRGGTLGWPYTDADGYTAFGDFSITSNWALEIPCFYNIGPEFYPDECYSTIQGTSMATPHVAAVLALLASQFPTARHNPLVLTRLLKAGAQNIRGNTTPGLSATDTSNGDATGLSCTTRYCHLGGAPISDREAYGAGLVDATGKLFTR